MLSEAPNRNPAKTKSVRKRWYWLMGVVIALVILIPLAMLIIGRSPQVNGQGKHELVVNQGTDIARTYSLEVVDTTEAQKQGLSGRGSLGADQGMLFAYKDGMHDRCIWMKDMKFEIDVLWLNSDKRVVSAVSNMRPSSYPQSYCHPAEWVIELPAGTMREQGIRPGQILAL